MGMERHTEWYDGLWETQREEGGKGMRNKKLHTIYTTWVTGTLKSQTSSLYDSSM